MSKSGESRRSDLSIKSPSCLRPDPGPNEVWSWDITKLKGPVKWTYFHLYVIMDIFSRYVVGWMVAHRESAALARRLIEETCVKQDIKPGQLIIHADRGPAMKAKSVAEFMGDIGVTKTHSRPYVSNDNPYSEAHFKTSSTARNSRNGLALSRMPGLSARSSSPGTTPSIGIQASGWSHPNSSITDSRRTS